MSVVRCNKKKASCKGKIRKYILIAADDICGRHRWENRFKIDIREMVIEEGGVEWPRSFGVQ